MDADARRREADAILCEALDVEPGARAGWLARRCGSDERLRRRVERLLEAAEGSDDGLTPDALCGGPLWRRIWGDTGADAFGQPETLGPWRIVRELARGGMAVVYVAERIDPTLPQTVALKLLHGGAGTDDEVGRFEQERAILAGLSHPNIAGLLDGGVSAAGRPYLAMELVQGEPIDRYCERRGLDVEARVRLMLQVGEAIRYAHRNLIVHRDIKPSNVLVDEHGTVKLLDFGIAKLLEPGRHAAEAPPTRRTLRVLTPEYASPEQVRGDPITTASDVYQLGLLTYELLTGVRAQRLDDASPSQIERICCEVDPPAPSARIAARPGRARRVRGDLDAIVLRALRKDPAARYPSVDALLEDLQRHLEGVPIKARPPTLGYRLGKFVRRRRGTVLATGAILASLVAGLVLAGWQAREARQERDLAQQQMRRAEEIRDFLVGLFEAADPDQTLGVEVTARQLLEQGAQRIDEELAAQPGVQAELYTTIGDVYLNLGAFEEARSHYPRALDVSGEGSPRTGSLLNRMAIAVSEQGRPEEAARYFKDALALREQSHGSDSPETAAVMMNLGLWHLNENRIDQAEELVGQAETVFRDTLGPRHAETLRARHNLGRIFAAAGRYEEAEQVLRDNLESMRALGERSLPNLGMSLQVLATLLHRQRRLDEAEPYYREALEVRRRLYGDEHPSTAVTLNNFGVLLLDRENFDDAEEVLHGALAARKAVFGERHPAVASTLGNLGQVRAGRGDLDAAERLQREALEILTETLGPEHPRTATGLRRLGETRHQLGRSDEGEELLRRALAILEAALPPEHPRIVEVRESLASVSTERRGGTERRTGAATPRLP